RSSSHGGRCGGQGPDGAPGEVGSRDFVSDWSPLHEASIHGRLLALKKLINQVWCVNFRTTDCVSPLHEACLGGHAACVSVLLKHGANVNATTIDWNTPLFNACVSGSVDCLNLLLQHRASPHPVCDLASPSMKLLKEVNLSAFSIDHNIKHLGTPLYVACENQQLKCAKKLLESGASANSGKDLDSPLHIAAQTSNVEMVHLLIDFGANTRAVRTGPDCPNSQVFKSWQKVRRSGPNGAPGEAGSTVGAATE
uniref:Ankyrin repeat and SOCS box containing 9 n=1 Tax=Naja naja TaxID=35670 RepID=A0A8C7E5M6_NAJNA